MCFLETDKKKVKFKLKALNIVSKKEINKSVDFVSTVFTSGFQLLPNQPMISVLVAHLK